MKDVADYVRAVLKTKTVCDAESQKPKVGKCDLAKTSSAKVREGHKVVDGLH
jgi:hypothetical protein